MVPFSMTLSDLEPRFKVTELLDIHVCPRRIVRAADARSVCDSKISCCAVLIMAGATLRRLFDRPV